MLIPIGKINEKEIYRDCQYLKDKYADGKIVGVYAAYYMDNKWVYHFAKTVLKDGKVETIDNYIYCDSGNLDWGEIHKKSNDFMRGVDCLINYMERKPFVSSEYDIENFDIEVMTMYCQYYFHYRGLNAAKISYARSLLEYGEGVNGIHMYNELISLINDILDGYDALLELDKEENKPE